LGCSFPIGEYKLWRHLATWQTLYRFGRALSLVPAKLSFCQCQYAFTTLQCLCYNCEKDPCSRSWFDPIHSTIGTSYSVQPSKSNESRCIKWTAADPQWFGGWFFWRN
jgi:hypothetical protein